MFKLKKYGGIVVALLMLVGMVGCGDGNEAGGSNDLSIQDRAGLDFVIPEEMDAIVSLAPSITIILIDLGLEDQMVAIDSGSAFAIGNPNDLPVFDMMAPEIESLIELEPDFVFASTMTVMDNVENDPFGSLRDLGIGVAYLPTSDSLDGIREDIRFIASVMGVVEAGEALIAEMDRELEEIATLVYDREVPLMVYFEITPAPEMFSFGSGVFLNEMLLLAGGSNVFSDLSDWLSVEAESVVSANPDVIFTNVNFIDDPVGEIMGRPGWEGMDAILNGRVYVIDNNDTSVPTHRVVHAIRAMAEYLN